MHYIYAYISENKTMKLEMNKMRQLSKTFFNIFMQIKYPVIVINAICT